MTRANLMRMLMSAIAATAVIGCKSASEQREARARETPVAEDTKPAEPTASVHVAAGDLALAQNNGDEAVKQYRKALEMDPSDDLAMYRLATVYAYARKFDDSIVMWQRYVGATGESAAGLSNLGRVYELSGDWKSAEAAYVKAIMKEPGNPTARTNYGIMLAKRERLDEAEAQLSKVLPPAEVQYNMGSVFEIRRDLTSARERYARAYQLDPTLIAAKQKLDQLRTPALSVAQ